MNIDRGALERELAHVRAQQQHFVRLVEQTNGAEKALLGLISILDKFETNAIVPEACPDTAVKAAVEGMVVIDDDDELEPTDYDLGRYERETEPVVVRHENINGAGQ